MSAHRFFLTGPVDTEVGAFELPLSPEDLHHAVSVLRVRPGEEIEVVEPAGLVLRVRVRTAEPHAIHADLIGRIAWQSNPDVTLFQCVAKGDKMDSIIRQAVEVGARAVVPIISARTIVRLDERKRAEKGERWRRVAKAAAEQSHRDGVPAVADPQPLADVLGMFSEYDRVLVLWEGETERHLASALESVQPHDRVALLVGPEGGLSAEEVALVTQAGAISAGLGPGILRTETAAVAGLAIAIHRLGGLGGSDVSR